MEEMFNEHHLAVVNDVVPTETEVEEEGLGGGEGSVVLAHPLMRKGAESAWSWRISVSIPAG